MSLNFIGLDSNKAEDLCREMNQLLASTQVFYMNVRGYHWNIQGAEFFQLHAKFEEVYNDLLLKVDEIAERILTLGGVPEHGYSAYLQETSIAEDLNQTTAGKCVNGLLSGYQKLLTKERSILELAAAADDEGTAALMSDYIKEQEKTVWMLHAFSNDSSSCSNS